MKSILALFLILTVTPFISAQKYSRIKVLANDQELKQIANLGVAVDHGIRKKNTFIITDLSEYEIDILNAYGYPYEIQIDDVKEFIKTNKKIDVFTYPADHGFNCNHRNQYNQKCSEIAFDRTIKFLEKNLY